MHRKFKMLCHLLNAPRPHVRGYLELLWESGYQNGDPLLGTVQDVALLAEYPGEPSKLVDSLLNCGLPKPGFIEEENGLYKIHDLFHHAPDYVTHRRIKEEERKGEKTCKVCGIVYHSSHSNSQTCSNTCRKQLSRVPRSPSDVTQSLCDKLSPSTPQIESQHPQVIDNVTHVTLCHTLSHNVTECHTTPAPAPAPALKENIKRKRFEFVPPTEEEARKHYEIKGYKFNFKTWFDHYTVDEDHMWENKEGKAVRSWKGTMVTFQSFYDQRNGSSNQVNLESIKSINDPRYDKLDPEQRKAVYTRLKKEADAKAKAQLQPELIEASK